MNIQALLKESSLAVTPARIALLEVLQKEKKPVDVQTLIEALQNENIEVNRVTVFRIINAFVEKGIVHKLEFSEGKARYELSSLPHHHHAVCTNCGKVQDIEDCEVEKIEKKVSENLSFSIQSHRLEFFGLCKNCSKS